MKPSEYEGRTMPGPVTLAACLLELCERLFARLIVLAEKTGDSAMSDALVEEFTDFRNEWRPELERIIRKGRL